MAAALRLPRLTRLLFFGRQVVKEQQRFSSSLQKSPVENPFKKPPPKGPVWVSWGFDETDYLQDRYAAHCVFFSFITLFGFSWAVYLSYFPDFREQDWAQREAYLLIREREAKGLPLIDRNYIPPEQVKLPTEEELGDFEIII